MKKKGQKAKFQKLLQIMATFQGLNNQNAFSLKESCALFSVPQEQGCVYKTLYRVIEVEFIDREHVVRKRS